MKKLLAMLTSISTIGSIMPMILANASTKIENNNLQVNNLKRNKRETISASDYLEFNNKSINKIFGIDGYVYNIIIDSKNNAYFSGNKKPYILKHGETIPKKIEGINDTDTISPDAVAVDSQDNVYFGTWKNGIYVLKSGDTTATKIEQLIIKNDIRNYYVNIAVDSKDNVYFGTFYGLYVLKQGETTLTKIEGINNRIWSIIIDSQNNIYFGTDDGGYKLSAGSNTPTKINGISEHVSSIAIDNNNNNVYFATKDNGIYVLKSGDTTATKLEEISGIVNYMVVDDIGNVYFGTSSGVYVLRSGQITQIKINNNDNYNVNDIKIDSNHNVYFLTKDNIYVFKNNETIAKKAVNFNKSKIWSYRYIAIDKNDDVYFGTNSDVYFLKKNIKKILKINEINNNISKLIVDNKNNIYFEIYEDLKIHNFYLLRFNEKNPTRIKQIIENKYEDNTSFLFVDQNNNFYFGNHNSSYVLKSGETKVTKIENIPNNIITVDFNKNNQSIYFATKDNGIYVLKSGDTTATKIEGISSDNVAYGFDNNKNLYFATKDNDIYVLKSGDTTATKIEGISNNNNILAIATDSQNNIYFSRWRDGLYLLKTNETKPIKIKELNNINLIAIDKNDNIYIFEGIINHYFKYGKIIINKINQFSDFIFDYDKNIYLGTTTINIYVFIKKNLSLQKIKGYSTFFSSASSIDLSGNQSVSYIPITEGAYVLKSGDTTATKLEEISDIVNHMVVDDIGNVYFGTKNGAYILKNKLNLNSIVKNFNLEKIENNDDETILNTLNYLNRESNYFLNLNKMKIINKTPTSATIVATKGKYRGEISVNYKIKNQDKISTIDLNDLVKKAVYFDFIDKNFHSFDKIKEIKDINIDNLNFGNVEVTRDSKLLHSVNFKEACFKKRERINTSSIKKTVKIPKCDYEQKSKLVFQITTGLTKTKQENKLNGWNINPDDEMKLHDFVNLNNKNSKIINVLSNEFDLSNTNKQEQEMILYSFSDVGDEIDLAPHERIIFKYSVGEIGGENTLNLKQKISGTITAKIIDNNNEEQTIILTIKEAMQILQKYSLLPDEITINEDNSITFNGKAKISLTQEREPKLILNTSIV